MLHVELHTVCKITHCVSNYTLCVQLHTVCKITHCVSNYTLCVKLHTAKLPFVGTFALTVKKFPSLEKIFHKRRLRRL